MDGPITMDENQIKQFETFTSEAVLDVFKKMCALELTSQEPAQFSTDEAGQIIGTVGFAGKANGTLHLYAGMTITKKISSHILGIPANKLDEGEMNDAFGELSNMIAGKIKSRLCDRGWPCVLTTPLVVRRLSVTARPSSGSRKIIGFRNSSHYVVAELLLKDLQSN